METKELIYQMLTENTGSHFLDSGGAGNRHWQRNQNKSIQDFENEKEQEIIKEGDYFERTVSVFHYLSELELDTLCEEFNKLNTNPNNWDADCQSYGVSREAWDYLIEYTDIKELRTWNTYNGESDLSQTLQGSNLRIFGEDYILIQIHGGADVRGGYTDAKLFKCSEDGLIHSYLQEFMYQEEIEEEYKYLIS